MAYLLFGLSLAAAALLLFVGIRQHLPRVTTGAEAQNCCWAPRGKETRCHPCRPTRDAN
jgi:hypothetical protein